MAYYMVISPKIIDLVKNESNQVIKCLSANGEDIKASASIFHIEQEIGIDDAQTIKTGNHEYLIASCHVSKEIDGNLATATAIYTVLK